MARTTGVPGNDVERVHEFTREVIHRVVGQTATAEAGATWVDKERTDGVFACWTLLHEERKGANVGIGVVEGHSQCAALHGGFLWGISTGFPFDGLDGESGIDFDCRRRGRGVEGFSS